MAYEPNDEHRRIVEEMSRYGMTQTSIAKCLDMTDKTLAKHYRKELDCAKDEAIRQVGNMLYKNCMDGKESSIFFFLKTQARWKETNHQEHRFVDKEGEDLHLKDKQLLNDMGIE